MLTWLWKTRLFGLVAVSPIFGPADVVPFNICVGGAPIFLAVIFGAPVVGLPLVFEGELAQTSATVGTLTFACNKTNSAK